MLQILPQLHGVCLAISAMDRNDIREGTNRNQKRIISMLSCSKVDIRYILFYIQLLGGKAVGNSE